MLTDKLKKTNIMVSAQLTGAEMVLQAFEDTNPSMLFDLNDFIALLALLSSSLLHTVP